jgi:ABC-type dipeptide/oligopeptide/nickel transport system permease component
MTLMYAATVIGSSLVSDATLAALDPRRRQGQ